MKTSKAQIEATRRYEAKTYKRITFNLRKEEHADIIESIEAARAQGENKNDWLRGVFDDAKKTIYPGDLVPLGKVEDLLWEHRILPVTIKTIMEKLKK